MAEELNMPQMGYDMKEGVVVKWLMEEGASVNIGDPIAEIETDKAVVEFESYAEGILQQILVEEGTKVNVGDAIAIVGDGSETTEEVVTPETTEEIVTPETTEEVLEVKIKASPLAKTLAKENNIDLNKISGTGPGGRIVKLDVENIINEKNDQDETIDVDISPNTADKPNVLAKDIENSSTSQESNKMRAQIARVTQRSKQEVPHYYLSTEINMDKALEIRSQINAKLEDQNIKISINDLII